MLGRALCHLLLASVTALLTGSALAQSTTNPKLSGCVYRSESPAKDLAERMMPLTLPYLDRQIVHYRDDHGVQFGYAVRRSLRVYFYEGEKLLGTALRRSPARTSYFSADGVYIGQCTNRKLIQPDDRPANPNPPR